MAPKITRNIRDLWSQLPTDIVDIIIKKLDSPVDIVSFSGVCKTWRYVALGLHMSLHCKLPMHHFVPKRNPLPMLLHLSRESPDMYHLYSLNEQKTYRLHLRGLSSKFIIGSGFGWLVVRDITNSEVYLLNPLTGQNVPLPLVSLSLENVFRKVMVGSYRGTLAVVASGDKKIWFCRIGDSKWTTIESSACFIYDVIMHNSKLYAIDILGRILEFDIADPTKEKTVAVNPVFAYIPGRCFLVDLCGQLVVIRASKSKGEGAMTRGFEVFKLAGSGWDRLQNLGHHMVFIGYNHTLSLDSRVYPRCSGNCIYFADCLDDYEYFMNCLSNQEPYHDVGVYHMEDQKVEHLENFCNSSLPMTMVWLSPNFSPELEVEMIP